MAEIEIQGDLEELYVAIIGSPRKVVIEPTKNIPEIEITRDLDRIFVDTLSDVKNVIDIMEEKDRVVVGPGCATCLVNVFPSVSEVTLTVTGYLKKITVNVCNAVSKVILRLFGYVKKLLLFILDVFSTKVIFRHVTGKGRIKRFLLEMKNMTTVVRILEEFLKNFASI